MRICLIASSRFPVREPFHGGLEAHTHGLATALMSRGHTVDVFAAPGSSPELNCIDLSVVPFESSAAARQDVGATSESWMQEHHAYLSLMMDLVEDGRRRYDIVHNNSLHHLPIAMAAAVGVPLVTTLHTPPIAWLESAMAFAPDDATFVAVSTHTARSWSHVANAEAVLNGVDTDRWRLGRGGSRAIWSGRIVPEKAPHTAMDAATIAGIGLDLAGPVTDPDYFLREVVPRLSADHRYVGHLMTDELVAAVGASRLAVVSPRWDEPYGLVAAEAMSCGTPVAALPRGAMPELVTPESGALAVTDDARGLAAAMIAAGQLDRRTVRGHAVRELSVDRMVRSYEQIYSATAARASGSRLRRLTSRRASLPNGSTAPSERRLLASASPMGEARNRPAV